MLRKTQIGMLVGLGVALWALVALNIRFRPEAVSDPVRGLVPFVAAPLGGWLSVRLCKLVGRLSEDQLLAGVVVVGAVAMMLDGAALKWFPGVYGFDERILRLSAAGLLWGYGVAFGVAVVWAMWSRRRVA
jgi:hypothetical protein